MTGNKMPSDTLVYIIDDDDAIRTALTLMLEQEGIATQAFHSAEAFLAQNLSECRRCAIVDIYMDGIDGIQLQKTLSKEAIILPIIFLTGYGNIPLSVKAMKAGAEDFLTKPITREKLLAAVHAALHKGEVLLAKAKQQQEAKARLIELTAREQEIMILAVTGSANKEIAHRLNISYRTVEHHKTSILRKTNTNSLLELAGLAQECGLLST
jgi:two-component system, LuxR family, response regulator FixJ